ncbi:MAG TPA: hypothetical protein VGO52_27555 [Hyphomonadaceae bacterium]|jgi:tricorn protease|nr:hypothetical protein [Hyphomonadaceae bacterium]
MSDKLGPLVGKRTWGGLVCIGGPPQLTDSAQVTSPSVGFFTPTGEWEVENNGVLPLITPDVKGWKSPIPLKNSRAFWRER